jgi:hypothetical protein
MEEKHNLPMDPNAELDWGRPQWRINMDSELGGGTGSLGAEIIFKNVPDGVETSAEGDGFDNFKVNKTRQLQSA